MSYIYGGNVEPAGSREYGRALLESFDHENPTLPRLRREHHRYG